MPWGPDATVPRRLRSALPRARQARHELLRGVARARRRLPPGRGDIALTFDDGPDPRFTPAVLDVLAAHGARATFFLVGSRVAEHPELVRRIRDEGHVVGSHSATHPDARRTPARQLRVDYASGRAALETALHGGAVALFRPPNGVLDEKGALVVRRLGLVPWLWNVDPEDWHPDTSEDDIVTRCAALRPGDVVLLHDGLERPLATRALDRSATVRALSRVLALLREQGLATGTIDPC